MRIRAIRAHEIGRFRAPVAVENLSGTLDVLTGPNELGKSTLLAALRWALLRRHTTTSIKDIEPYGGGHPLVELDFETGAPDARRPWRIRKRFSASSRQRLAELTALDTAETWRGPDAEERLADLIGAHDRAHGRFALLLVGQRETHGDKIAPDPAAGGSLASAIEREIAAVASGSRLRDVRATVQHRLDQCVTARSGRPKTGSPYAEALRRRDEIAAELSRARDVREQHARRLDALADKRRRLAALTTDGDGPTAEEAVAEAGRRLEAARRAELAHARARTAAADAQARADALGRLDKALDAQATGAQTIADVDAQLAAAAAALQAADAEAEATARRLADLAAEARRLAQARELQTAAEAAEREQASLADAEATLAAAHARAAEIAAIRSALAANPVTLACLDDLATATQDRAVVAARLEAATTRVTITYEDGVDGAIRIGEAPLADGDCIEVDGHLVLDIPSVGRIEVASGVTDAAARDTDSRHLAKLDAHLAEALAAAGVSDIAEARRRRADRERLEQTLAEAGTRLSTLAPEGLERLAADVAARRAALVSTPARPSGLPSVEEIAHRLVAIEATRVEAEAAARKASDARSAARSVRDTLAAELQTRRQHHAALAASLPLPAVRAEERSRLAAAADDAARMAAEAQRTAETLAPSPPDAAALTQLAAAHEAARARHTEEQHARESLTIEINRLEAALCESIDGEAAPRADALDGMLAEAAATVAAHEADIAALRLLADELDAAEREARDRYVRPVTQRLAPHLDRLFGSAELHFDDSLAVTALARDGVTEAITRLSDGTREQLAVLARVGFGRLLADTGSPAPLVLDDPLVFSDDERLARMFESLTDAARHHQVIVLTCHARAFDGLAGTKLAIAPWQPDVPVPAIARPTAAE